ncbi:sulfatase-like hydrolase/transferase [Actinomycetes bacterium KLBMP 9797]
MVGWTLTALATALVFVALVIPDRYDRVSTLALIRIPIEGLLGFALLLVLPTRWRRPVAVAAGALLGVVVVLKVTNMVFRNVMDRPFNLVLDWGLLDDGYAFLRDSVGRTGAVAALVGAVLLVAVVPALMALATLRVAGFAVRHKTAGFRVGLALTAAWVACFVVGAQIVPRVPVASRQTASFTYYRSVEITKGLQDSQEFAKLAASDPFRDTPSDQLLSALRGKDVVVTFIESYGRDAVESPTFAPQVTAVLDDGTQRLAAAGYGSQSAFLTSSTFGGGSWWAHATTLSGLWINNEQRYRTLVAGDRTTLNSAFQRAGWRTSAFMPGITRAWPESKFYGYDKVYDLRNMGYRGPGFGFATMPDQFVWLTMQRNEHSKATREPMMAQLALLSSHAPWVPIPRMVGWNEVGDGSIFHQVRKEGFTRKQVWSSTDRIRTEYRRSIEYSLSALISYVETYGDENLVMVFLGDHQPSSLVVGEGASHDVPISIITKDQAVLNQIASWKWTNGLKPGAKSPVWKMDSFRDRFLTTFSPEATHR